jgi:hypothetical protein
LAVTNWHRMQSTLTLEGNLDASDNFCCSLRDQLKLRGQKGKEIKPFFHTCFSEYLLMENTDEMKIGGLGVTHGFPTDGKR